MRDCCHNKHPQPLTIIPELMELEKAELVFCHFISRKLQNNYVVKAGLLTYPLSGAFPSLRIVLRNRRATNSGRQWLIFRKVYRNYSSGSVQDSHLIPF